MQACHEGEDIRNGNMHVATFEHGGGQIFTFAPRPNALGLRCSLGPQLHTPGSCLQDQETLRLQGVYTVLTAMPEA
jgi:hypothetical protein